MQDHEKNHRRNKLSINHFALCDGTCVKEGDRAVLFFLGDQAHGQKDSRDDGDTTGKVKEIGQNICGELWLLPYRKGVEQEAVNK